MDKNQQSGLAHIILVLLLFILVVAGLFLSHRHGGLQNFAKDTMDEASSGKHPYELSPIEAGKQLTQGACEGEGVKMLTNPPMKLEDIGVIVPYGSTIDDHVTPIDHQYFYPKVFRSEPHTYEVRAMGDGTVYYIDEYRLNNPFNPRDEYSGDFGLKISQSCTHLYWYGLMTKLSPKLEAAFDTKAKDGEVASKFVSVDVKAGEVVGWIGGQTLDFAVLDTSKPLDGFISPELYTKSQEKLFTAHPDDYYTDELSNLLASKNPRTADPIGGKIDYDIAGKLRGNWFVKGTGGFNESNPEGRHEFNHLSVYPDHFDPSSTVVSVGDFKDRPAQFAVREKTDPAKVGVGDGVVKYTLYALDWVRSNGQRWDGLSYQGPLRVKPGNRLDGCALFEMSQPQQLKAELVPDKDCSQVSGFSDKAKTYTR